MLFFPVFANQNPSRPAFLARAAWSPLYFRQRDEKPVTATPLESASTNCDACNSFRIRFYENCRVTYPSPSIFVSLLSLPHKKMFCKSFVFCALRTLSFSVSRKSFICHSYENNRGVAQLFPFWNFAASNQLLAGGAPPGVN